MDFRNFCSKIDVDAIRAKFPPLPEMVTQIKLPKSMSKLNSRKIFRSSRDDVNADATRSSSKRSASADVTTPKFMEPAFAIPSSEFVNHTPQRISTISSLVDQRGGRGGRGRGRSTGDDGGDFTKRRHLEEQDEESFYRSAGGIEDYCPSPLRGNAGGRFSALSPSRRTESHQNVQMSFKEKVQKGYKDVSEFRLKHLFAKKTVVRQDGIMLDTYVQGLKEDRRRQERAQEKRDRAIADNYDFNFKISRRKSEESFGVSTPRDSPVNRQHPAGHKKPLSEQSGDESGMEQSPPKRKPGIAATRFSRVRSIPLQMSLDEDDDQNQEQSDFELSDHEEQVLSRANKRNEIRADATLQPHLNKSRHIQSPQRKPALASSRFGSVDKKVNKNQELTDLELSDDDEEDDEEEDVLRRPDESTLYNKPTEIAQKFRSIESPKFKPNVTSSRPSQVPFDKKVNKNQEQTDLELSEDDEEEEEKIVPRRANESTLYNKLNKRRESLADDSPQPHLNKTKSIKKRLKDIRKSSEEESKTGGSLKKRQAPLSPQQSEESVDCSTPPLRGPASASVQQTEKPLGVIKQNFKRFQKSIKFPTSHSAAQSGAESDEDEPKAEGSKTKQSKTQQFAERLRRFRSVDNVDKQTEDDEVEHKTPGSPLHKLTAILQEWKRGLKKKASDTHNTDDDEVRSPEKRDKLAGTLIRKLQHIRARKQQNTTDDPDEDEEGGDTYKGSFKSRAKLQLEKGVAAASQMPQITMEKLKETKKYFRKKPGKEQETEVGKKAASKHDSDQSDLDLDEDEEEAAAKTHKPKQSEALAKTKNAVKPAASRHYYSSDDEVDDDEDEVEPATKVTLEPYQQNVLVPLSRTSWTAKPIRCDSTGDDDDDDMLPRVLIHQDNSDIFESTLIIAVTRPIPPRSHSPSPYITEIPPDSPLASPTDSPKQSTPETKADNWVPSREIISSFRQIGSPPQRKDSRDSMASSSGSRGHSRKHSMDSSSEDSWIKDVPRGPSSAIGLNSVYETEEPWRVKSVYPDDKIYKSKSIDIFEIHTKQGGSLEVFDDFDDELKNTPVVKIDKNEELQAATNESFDHDDSSEELDNPDDDNSSRITKILKQPEPESQQETSPPKSEKLKAHLYGNSQESLMGNVDENEGPPGSGNEEDDEDSAVGAASDEGVEYDRPPSSAPSPPPPISPPPPPLPQRQPSIRLSKFPKPPTPPPEELPSPPITLPPPPPLPQTKPPAPLNRPVGAPPKIPDRTPSMSKVAKPLVKTASLRLAYSEQVNPEDVGKVNKLISRFEPNVRPRIIPRKPYMAQESDDYSDQEEDDEDEDEDNEEDEENENIRHKLAEINANTSYGSRNLSRDITPTNNKPILQKSFSMEADDLPPPPARAPPPAPPAAVINENNNNNAQPKAEIKSTKRTPAPVPQITTSMASTPTRIPSISISSNQSDTNSNFSQPSSEYGSPMAYPSSLVGSSNEVTPLSSRKETDYLNTRRSRRSMTRDDERFYSFDSDEENSYYSISSTGSSRYIVEL